MAEVFVIGDTHFGHTKIIEFEKTHRPYKTIEDHDDDLIARWNAIVSYCDTVIHLGDVAFGSFEISRLNELNGTKRLIMGNHDKYERLKPYFQDFHGAKYGKYDIVFTHIPVAIEQLIYRFKANIHGHMHSKSMSDPRYINVSAELTNLQPLPIELVYKRLKDLK